MVLECGRLARCVWQRLSVKVVTVKQSATPAADPPVLAVSLQPLDRSVAQLAAVAGTHVRMSSLQMPQQQAHQHQQKCESLCCIAWYVDSMKHWCVGGPHAAGSAPHKALTAYSQDYGSMTYSMAWSRL
jgi:hypothetical protein